MWQTLMKKRANQKLLMLRASMKKTTNQNLIIIYEQREWHKEKKQTCEVAENIHVTASSGSFCEVPRRMELLSEIWRQKEKWQGLKGFDQVLGKMNGAGLLWCRAGLLWCRAGLLWCRAGLLKGDGLLKGAGLLLNKAGLLLGKAGLLLGTTGLLLDTTRLLLEQSGYFWTQLGYRNSLFLSSPWPVNSNRRWR